MWDGLWSSAWILTAPWDSQSQSRVGALFFFTMNFFGIIHVTVTCRLGKVCTIWPLPTCSVARAQHGRGCQTHSSYFFFCHASMAKISTSGRPRAFERKKKHFSSFDLAPLKPLGALFMPAMIRWSLDDAFPGPLSNKSTHDALQQQKYNTGLRLLFFLFVGEFDPVFETLTQSSFLRRFHSTPVHPAAPRAWWRAALVDNQ